MSYHNVEVIYREDKNQFGALEYYREENTFTIHGKLLPNEHSRFNDICNTLRTVYRAPENFADVLECFQRALEIYNRTLCCKHPPTALVCEKIGIVDEMKNVLIQAATF